MTEKQKQPEVGKLVKTSEGVGTLVTINVDKDGKETYKVRMAEGQPPKQFDSVSLPDS